MHLASVIKTLSLSAETVDASQREALQNQLRREKCSKRFFSLFYFIIIFFFLRSDGNDFWWEQGSCRWRCCQSRCGCRLESRPGKTVRELTVGRMEKRGHRGYRRAPCFHSPSQRCFAIGRHNPDLPARNKSRGWREGWGRSKPTQPISK